MKIIKKYIILSLLSITMIFGQTYDLKFVEILNDKTVAGNYDVQIQIQSSEVFKMASSNITFGFNNIGLSSPSLQTVHNFDGVDAGPPMSIYGDMTVTLPIADVTSINIVFNQTDELYGTKVPMSWIEVATVRFTIENTSQTTQFEFRSDNPSPTEVYSCSGSGGVPSGGTFTTELKDAGAWTGLEVSLPVELSAFTAEDGVDGVLLKWTTESETENLGFMLERRAAKAENWNIIASYKTDDTLLGQGSTPAATDYEYIDNLVENGKEYEYRLGDVDYQGIITYHATRFVTVNNIVLKVIPEKFELFAAYPNPFNPHSTIRFSVPDVTDIKITIYNHLGQEVRVLQNGIMQPGEHSVVWDSSNKHGQPVSAGVYLFNIDAGVFNKTQKIILLK